MCNREQSEETLNTTGKRAAMTSQREALKEGFYKSQKFCDAKPASQETRDAKRDENSWKDTANTLP